MIDKKQAARHLEEIATLLELSGENPFKARSYTTVARRIEQLDEDLDTLVREKRLREIKGVGEALEQKIEELVTTGELGYLNELRAKFPERLFELFRVPGLGAKRIKTLYEELGIASLGELEYACNENRLVGLKGFGPAMQAKALEGVAYAKRHEGLFHAHRARRAAEAIIAQLREVPGLIRIETAGSLRRWKEVVKDVDIVASCEDPEALMQRFVELEDVEQVTGRGSTKSSVTLRSGLAADLRVVTDEQFPFALAHFTGSKDHNVAMRQRAKDRGRKLNEYGLFEGDALVPCADETALFAALDLPYLPPETREDMGELDLDRTPRLVERDDLIGVFHCHTTASDGGASLEQMAEAARERGYAYLLIADHSQSAAYAGGLTLEEIEKQHAAIDALNAGYDGFRVLKGIESDIRSDGALDYDDEVLATFDLVVASVHSRLNMNERDATERVLRAIAHPATAILGHPTGRLLLSREGYPLDWDRIFTACVERRTALEINANPHRLDLDWRLVRRARDHGVMLCIGPDAHDTAGFDDVQYGLGVARKGWLGPEHLLNCLDLDALLAWKRGGADA